MLHVSRARFVAGLAVGTSRAWAGFGRWRRSRPFWGGLLLILSALEMYGSAHQDLTPVKVSFGPQVFMSWLIPGALLLCGLLTWFTPAQRAFYGILGALIAVAALIGLNFGGFFIGLLLGLTGGALAVAWTPTPVPTATQTPSPTASARPGSAADPEVATGEPDPGPPTVRLPAVVLLVVVMTAGLLTLPRAGPAWAAPCPTSPGAPVTTPPTTGGTPTPSASSPATGATTETNPIVGFFDSLGRLLGIGGGKASPGPSPTPTPTAPPATPAAAARAAAAAAPAAAPNCGTSPTPRKSTSRTAGPSPSASAAAGSSVAPGTGKVAAVPAGQPLVNKQPSRQTAAKLSEMMLFFDGVANLPVAGGGTLRALRFHLDSATSVPFELDVPVSNGAGYTIKSSRLVVSGHVVLYATEIKGTAGLFGLDILPVDYTPDAPPPITPPIIEFANATVQLVFIHADTLTAANLNIGR